MEKILSLHFRYVVFHVYLYMQSTFLHLNFMVFIYMYQAFENCQFSPFTELHKQFLNHVIIIKIMFSFLRHTHVFVDDLSWLWLFCLGPLVFCFQRLLNDLKVFQTTMYVIICQAFYVHLYPQNPDKLWWEIQGPLEWYL